MPYIIAPIYKFFNHNATLYGIAEPFTIVNGQDEQAMPAVDKYSWPRLYGAKMAKATSAFAIKYYNIFYICLQHFMSPQEIEAPFGHQTVGFIVISNALTGEKVSITTVFKI